METRKLLIRMRDETDKRRIILKITEKRKEAADIFLDEKKGKNLYACLNQKETLKQLLEKLVKSWYTH